MASPTLLCIDDRPQMLEIRKAALEPHGYRVKLASTAMSELAEHLISIIERTHRLGQHSHKRLQSKETAA
jgi:CheY-like chemotaxis protein